VGPTYASRVLVTSLCVSGSVRSLDSRGRRGEERTGEMADAEMRCFCVAAGVSPQCIFFPGLHCIIACVFSYGQFSGIFSGRSKA
jgi:hypothetical protein